MKEKQVAKIYATSFMQIGKEKNVDVTTEFTKFTEVINASNDLENVFFLDVFTNEEKMDVFKAIATKINLSQVSVDIISYLIAEKRLGLFPVIFKEMVVVDDFNRGFIRGTIEGSSDSIDEESKAKIIKILKDKIGKEPNLTYVKKDEISAGYKVTVEDLQFDASLDNQLKQFKETILN
jgi:F-type H+-transporting ATPase subunit delta